MMKYLKIYYILLVYLTIFTVFSRDIEKSSENNIGNVGLIEHIGNVWLKHIGYVW